MANPEKLAPNTFPNRKSEFTSSDEEQQARQVDTETWFKMVIAWLPRWIEQFNEIPDPRHPKHITHQLCVLIVYGILLFLFQCASRRAANRELTQPGVWENLQAAFPELATIPHRDTVARLVEEIPPENFETVIVKTIRRLLKNGQLRHWMVLNHYLVAVDGAVKWGAPYPWAAEALKKETEAGTWYQAYVVAVVLVCPQGVTLPLLAEFCTNPVDAALATQQDSELKVFYRVAKRLYEAFPRWPLVLLADGLYPNGPWFEFLNPLGWPFMIVLKAGNLSAWQKDAAKWHRLVPDQQKTETWGDREQHFWWVNDLEYTWSDSQTKETKTIVLHYVVCEETWTDAEGIERKSTWAWVSSERLSKKNVATRCHRMARHRWDIEEPILVEKHHGYDYTHRYSRDWNGMQGFHALMRMAHILHVLALHHQDLWPTVLKLTVQGTLKWIRETIAGRWLDRERLALLREQTPRRRLRLIW